MNVREDQLRQRIDPALSRDVLESIASRALGHRAGVVRWAVLSGGCWNRVLGIRLEHGDLVLKISPEPGDRTIIREHAVLAWFCRNTSFPVPTPLLVDSSGSEIPGTWLLMTRVPGRVMHEVVGLLDSSQQARVIVQIAETLAALHQTTAKLFGGVELPEEARVPWPAFWLPRFDAVLEEVARSDLVSARFIDEIVEIRDFLPALLDIGDRSTLTHYDIWSGNVMISADGSAPRVTGYIDVPGYWADPARELSFAELFGMADARFYQAYRSASPPDESWDLRKDAYNLKMNLKHITMYPHETFYRDGARRCLTSLKRGL